MNRKAAVAVVLGAMMLPNICRAESLGEIAKRETERRKKVEESGKGASQVVHETELWQAKGKIANEGGAAPAIVPDDSSSVSSTSPTGSSASADASKKRNEDILADWAAKAAILQTRVADAEKALVAAKAAPLSMSGGSGGTVYKDTAGRTLGYSQGSADYMSAKEAHEQHVATAQAAVDAARKQQDAYEDQARRARIPPGVLRGDH
jgi:hypothetical protein